MKNLTVSEIEALNNNRDNYMPYVSTGADIDAFEYNRLRECAKRGYFKNYNYFEVLNCRGSDNKYTKYIVCFTYDVDDDGVAAIDSIYIHGGDYKPRAIYGTEGWLV